MIRSASRLFIAASLISALIAPALAAPPNSGPFSPRPSLVETVRSPSLCNNWIRECARFHGYQTQAWHACMGQPQARYDCGSGSGRRSSYNDDYDYAPVGRCSTWKRECAKLHGWQTYNWHQCMGQPGARRSCR